MNIKPINTNKEVMINYIFDPLTTIIKLAVLKNKKIGTKISIKNNNIYIQEIGMFQSIVRYYHGDTKSDIHFLSIPIELACNRYITDQMINKIPEIIILFKYAQDGLTNLMETYIDYPIIVHCLKYYFSIIETHINEQLCDRNCITKHKIIKVKTDSNLILQHNKKKKQKDKTEDINEIIDEIIDKIPEQLEQIEIDLYTTELLDKFYLIWTDSKINIVLGMIKYLLLETSPIDYVKCIETFIIPIDAEVYNIIHQ